MTSTTTSPATLPGPGQLRALAGVPLFRRDVLTGLERGWQTYGDLYRVRLGRRRDMFICSHPDLAQEVLVSGRDHFRRIVRPGGRPFGLELALGQGLITSEGALWQQQRRMMQPMFHRQRIESMTATMAACGERMLRRLEAVAADNRVIDLNAEMRLVTLDVINRTMFSSEVVSAVEAIGAAVDESLRYVARRERAIVTIPLGWPTPAARRFRNSMSRLDSYLYRLIEERKTSQPSRGDLLDWLIAARDAETGEAMSDRQIRDEVATIYGAGHETTANALTWAWYALSAEPDVLKRLQTEVDVALAGGTSVAAVLEQLPYTRMVFEESLRCYPPVPINGRTAFADTTLGGAAVPAGAVAVIVTNNIHRHPDFWEDGDAFRPGRFHPEARQSRHRLAYQPFGAGPHMCMGNHFAMIEGQLLLALMARHFDFELAVDRPVGREVNITMRPRGGLPVRVFYR